MPPSAIALAAAAAVLAAGGGWLFARRAARARADRLARDLDAARSLLRDYILERETSEETLRESERRALEMATRYRDMFEQHGAVQFLLDPETQRIVDANEAACEFYGYPREKLTGMHISEINQLAPEEIRAEMERATSQRHPYFVFPHRLASGEVRSVEVHSARVHLSGRELLYSIIHDITERRRAEHALAESEARYRALIARAAYGIYRSTREGRFLEVNPALVAMLGYASERELLAADIKHDIYFDAASRDRLMAAHDEQLDRTEVQWKRRDGTPITVRLSARIVRDEAGGILYFEGIAEDVTERLRQEELLRRSERMASLGHTLAGAAHELNNPLAAICGFAQLLLRDARDADDRSALETIHHEAARAGRIVKDLLTFARRQEGQRRAPVDVTAITRYIVESQRYAIETRGIRRELSLEPGLPPVLGDASQLEQVVLNLIVNARQALEMASDARHQDEGEGAARVPRIAIRTALEGGFVRLVVEDNGPGIPPAQLSRIWDPFWTTKPEGVGTGLGLSVVHGIIASHGGTIEVTSDASRGTRFVVSLPPLNDVPALLPPDESETRLLDRPAPRALDILLVDDEPGILGYITRVLSRRGHAVLTATDAEQARRIAEHSAFDVVVCDLRSAGADRVALVRALRALPTCAAARFVLPSDEPHDTPGRLALAAMDGVVVLDKPYGVEQLRDAVELAPPAADDAPLVSHHSPNIPSSR